MAFHVLHAVFLSPTYREDVPFKEAVCLDVPIGQRSGKEGGRTCLEVIGSGFGAVKVILLGAASSRDSSGYVPDLKSRSFCAQGRSSANERPNHALIRFVEILT